MSFSFRRTLPWRIGLASGAAALACGLAVVGIDAAGRFEREGRDIRRSAASMLAFVDADTVRALVEGDRKRATEIVGTLATLRYIRRVEMIATPDGTPTLSLRVAAAEPVGRRQTAWILARAIQYRFLAEDGGYARAIHGADGRTIGTIRLVYDVSAIAADQIDATLRAALQAALSALLMAAVASAVVWRTATRPIRGINERLAGLRDERSVLAGLLPRGSGTLDPRTEIGQLLLGFDRALRKVLSIQDDLERQAVRDPATGASTRIVALDHLRRAILAARRSRQSVVVIAVGIDAPPAASEDFCTLADPTLMRAVSERLRLSVREGDIVARIADTAFLVLADQISDLEEASDLAQRLRESVRMPVETGNPERMSWPVGAKPPTLSLGVAIAPEDHDDAMQVVEFARAAARAAESAGGDRIRFHSRIADERTQLRRSMERALARDIETRKIAFVAQPKARCRDGRVDSCEILARWRYRDEQGGERDVPPSEFVALAEQCGLIGPLGDVVLEAAAGLAARVAPHGIRVAFNVSHREMEAGSEPLSVRVLAAAAAAGVDPAYLEVEITESVIARSLEAVWAEFDALRLRGTRISVDDFGTGSANFSALLGNAGPGDRRAVTGIKMDARFVATLPEESRLAETILALARMFDLECVAEGVENAAQARWLAENGATRLQGWFVHKPIPIDDFANGVVAGIYERPVNWNGPGALEERSLTLAGAARFGALARVAESEETEKSG